MARNPEALAKDIDNFHHLADEMGVEAGPVTVMTSIPADDAEKTIDGYRQLGIERLICSVKYSNAGEFHTQLEKLAALTLA